MKKKGFTFTSFSVIFLLIILGIIIGIIIYHYNNIPLAETINIVDLATLVTTIFLAVYVPVVLDKKLEINTGKKKLIENRIQELQILYKKINLHVQLETKIQKDFLFIKNTLDICNYRLLTIITLLEYSNMKTSFEKEINILKSLCTKHQELLLSEKMEEVEFNYTSEIQKKEELLYNQIDKESCLLIFKINEA